MKLPAAVRRNAGLKLLSLAFAVLLWTYVNAKGRLEVTLQVPLELRNVPANLVLLGDPVDEVSVRLRGAESRLRALPQHLRATLDLSGATPGELSLVIGPQHINVPPNVEVLRVTPRKVTIRLDELVRRPVPVQPAVVGQPPPGFEVARSSVNPDRVVVEGARSVVERIRELRTTPPVDVSAATHTFTESRQLDLQGHELRVVDHPAVAVTVTIRRRSNPTAR